MLEGLFAFMYIHIYIYMYTYIYICMLRTHQQRPVRNTCTCFSMMRDGFEDRPLGCSTVCMCISIYIYIHSCIYMCVYTYMCTYIIHTYIYIYIYICTHMIYMYIHGLKGGCRDKINGDTSLPGLNSPPPKVPAHRP